MSPVCTSGVPRLVDEIIFKPETAPLWLSSWGEERMSGSGRLDLSTHRVFIIIVLHAYTYTYIYIYIYIHT